MARTNNSIRLQMESLEQRRLMAAYIDYYYKDLVITGTAQADTIYVSDYTNSAGVKFAKVTYNGAAPTEYFKIADIKGVIKFDGLGGNDYFNNNVNTLRTSAIGGLGNDTLKGGDMADTLVGGIGNDYLYGYEGSDLLKGEAGTDRLYGGNGGDSLDGGDDSDYLWGEGDSDMLAGGKGNDSLYGAAGNDNLFGGDGADLLDGGFGNDYLRATTYEMNSLNKETLVGGEGNDELIGGWGADQLDGGAGNDTLSGSEGIDFLTGGEGNDLFYQKPSQPDTILDATSNDHVQWMQF